MIFPVTKAAVTGRTVLVRAGLDVPMQKDGHIADIFRLQRALPTVNFLRRRGARTILLGHHGQPHGRRVRALSLRPVARELSRLLHTPVAFTDMRGAQPSAQALNRGSVLLLENLRFSIGEECAARTFARALATLGDLYVNDDFSTSHRAHASMVLLPKLLPAYAGVNLLREMHVLDRMRHHPRRPFIVMIGGGKVSDKFSVIEALLPTADRVLLGGAGALTFLRTRGIQVGKSLIDPALAISSIRRVLRSAKILMPVDWRVATRPSSTMSVVCVDAIPANGAAYDIGPATARLFRKELRGARAVLWAGPMGLYEQPASSRGTSSVIRGIPKAAYAVAGGGDTLAAIHKAHAARKFAFLSTSGSAMLAYLAGKQLPAIRALDHSKNIPTHHA